MSEPATITPRDNSNNKVTGPVRILEGEVVFLCRCGHSQEKPFCDSSHKRVGFESVVRASDFPL
jgi:CDGSH-type Zn-finger protein